ncbi:MAG: DUF1190 family protein [Enterobacteriaceae bacterium]
MKRTNQINKEAFRKASRLYPLTPIALAMSVTLLLTGCEQADQSVTLYQNADDCSAVNPSLAQQCQQSYQAALQEAAKTAPKYASRADCVAEFGENECTEVAQNSAPQTQTESGQQQVQQQSGGTWMPLLAGYMMGRMMSGGYSQQPLFTSKSAGSPMNGKLVDASGRSYGAASYGRTMTVDKSAMAPKPATTSTVTRGGFGETVNKQNTMMRKSSGTSGSRSMGG